MSLFLCMVLKSVLVSFFNRWFTTFPSTTCCKGIVFSPLYIFASFVKVRCFDLSLGFLFYSINLCFCGSVHELLIAKFRVKLKKRGKTSRPFRYDLNQIPNNYTVDVRNRFRTRSDRVPDELWMEVHDIVQETGSKTNPKKKKCKKANLSEEALQIAVKKGKQKAKEKRKDIAI